MKIVLVIPTLIQGGAERVMSELANEFTNKGHEVHLCLLVGGEHFYALASAVKVYDLGFVNKGPLQRIVEEIKVFLKLRALLKSVEPGFVLSFMSKYNVFTIMASSFLNINVFVSDRSNPRKKLPYLTALLRRLTYRFATGVVAQTTLAKELIEKETGNKNVRVISNPLREFTSYPDIERKQIILNVGRMVPEKGQKYLLEAFAKIKNSDWELVILGDGPLKDDLEIQAKKLNISNRVKMPGSVKNVDEWLAKSSIFVFPSVSEGFPNALVEAMAAGMPCVSFDCDAGPRDLIENKKNGFLIPIGDIDSFKEAIKKLVNNVSLREKIGLESKLRTKDLKVEEIANKYFIFCSEKIDL